MTSSSASPKEQTAVLPDIAGLFAIIIFVSLAIGRGTEKLYGPDTFWHIRAGQIMLAEKTILTKDIFSHTAFDKAWTAHEWLSEVIIASFHQFGGKPAVALFFAFLIAVAFWMLYRMCRRVTPDWLATLIVLVAYVLSCTHLLARPHIFTLFLGIITLTILKKGRESRLSYLLPLITAVWANLHGGFMLSILFQLIFITGAVLDHFSAHLIRAWHPLWHNLKKPLLILLASTLAACCTPFGYHLLLFPFYLTSSVFTQHIAEWRSADFQNYWYLRYYFLLVLLILFFHAKKITWTGRLFILYFANAALAHIRHFSLAGIFLSPIWAEALSGWAAGLKFPHRSESKKKDIPLSSRSGLVITIVLFVLFLALTRTNSMPPHPVFSALYKTRKGIPVEAIKYLKEHPQEGKMFNNYGWGGIMIYTFGPEQKVFIDGRADMYGKEIFTDYFEIIKVSGKTDSLLDEYGVDWVLYKSESALTRYLKKCGEWREIYQDETASILVREKAIDKTPVS